jgi:hypothetical protein
MSKAHQFSFAVVGVLAVGMFSSVHAQTVSTPVVGFQKKTIQASGFTSLGPCLVQAPIINTTVASKSGSSVTLAGSLGTVDTTKFYYLEVVDGALAGERVDVSLTSSSSGISILPSPRNTSDLSGLTVGTKVCIRRHLVLRDIAESVSPALVGNDNTTLCDRILVYDNGLIAYNKDALGAWIQDSELDDVTDTLIIAPGSGVLVHRRSASATSFTQVGTVRSNPFARPFNLGFQFIAPAYPLGLSPNSLQADKLDNWSANDRIIPFTSGGFVEYVFDPNDTSGSVNGTWYESSQLDPMNGTVLISSDGAGMIYRSINDPGIVETSPLTP